MYFKCFRLALLAMFCCAAATAHASFVIPVDTDGADDGPYTPHPNFSFGPGTTAASTSVRSAKWDWSVPTVVGLPDGDSLFGGDAVADPDTYQYSYTPGTDGDNTAIAPGTSLNDDGFGASGQTAGKSGRYRIYATWPQSNNMSGGLGGPGNDGDVLYALNDGIGDIASIIVDQNEDGPLNGDPGGATSGGADGNFKGGEWQFLFEASLDAGTTYVLRQQPTFNNGFVSMRAGGAMFEFVPEPTSALLSLAGLICVGAIRRR